MMYSLISIVALFVTATINSDILFNKKSQPINRKALFAYRFLHISAGLYFLFDFLWGILDQIEPKIYVEIDTTLYFMCMGLFLFAWFSFISRYLNSNKTMKIFLSVFSLLFLLGGLSLSITNFFYPVLFSYSEDSYTANIGRNIYLISQIVMFALTSLYTFIVAAIRKGEKTTQYIAIGISAILMSSSIVAQFYFPLLPFYGIGCFTLLTIIHTFVDLAEKESYQKSITKGLEREKEVESQLNKVQEMAYSDSLTGVKSKHSYVEFEAEIDLRINKNEIKEFALFLFDLNDLKLINDTYGHEIGDKYIIKSCDIITKFIPNAPLFRYGGDEFVAFLTDEYYDNRYKILEDFNSFIESNINTNEPIISAGFADFIPEIDNTLSSVFARADESMYHRKKYLKGLSHPNQNNISNPANEGKYINSRMTIYELFFYNEKLSLIDMLNNSNCDEILEVDLNNDSYKQIYHVEGKYFVPDVGSSFAELSEFVAKHIVHPDDAAIYRNFMKKEGFFERLKNANIPNFDFAHFRYRLQSGEYRYVEQCVITGKENGFSKGKFKIFLFDINNLKTRQLGMISDDTNIISIGRDKITGLITGKEFFNYCEGKVNERPDLSWCITIIDIEHFKIFNEWLGKARGSELLSSLGTTIVEFEKEYNAVGGFFGSGAFAVLMPFDKELVELLYRRIKKTIDVFEFTGGLLPAFGVAEIEKDQEIVDAFDNANVSISKAKADIETRICYFDKKMHSHVEQEYRILSNFAKALNEEEITFFLQPQVRISTGAVVGAEALARWLKKDGTIVSPIDFVPVLEKYGFITDLDKYIWERVCIWINKMINENKEIVPISINVSRVDIFSLDLATIFHDLCEKYQIPHKYLKIEITESIYATAMDKIEDLVKKLHDDNFIVMMDDFGSGYSSLNMLSNLKIDAIKLDARFLQFDGKDAERGIHILESVVNMSKTMALPIVVEGVETKEQNDFLAELGCRYVQGFYFYRPISIEKFEKIISNKKMVDHRGIIVKINEQFRIREFLDRNIYSDSMLNNIIGAVAIYSLNGEHLDIIRYNEQFYKTVNVPDFVDRLVNIEQFVPEEDRPGLFKALHDAKENKLLGASVNVRFMLTNGNLSFYDIRFYYLGKKEGTDQFYGSAHNVSDLLNVVEEKKLISEYSKDNIIFIRKVYDKWDYTVSSHGLADVFGLSVEQLEKELNNGTFAHRVDSTKELRELMKEGSEHAKNGEDFEYSLIVNDKDHNKVKLHFTFIYVKEKTSNIIYLLISNIVK